MLVQDEKHKKWHSIGPKDCHWGSKEQAVASINMTRSTIEGEQMSISVPIFADEDRSQLEDRLGLCFSILQDRLEDGFKAWKEVADKEEEARKTIREE